MVLAVGILISRKFNISYVPLFVCFGILSGPALGLIYNNQQMIQREELILSATVITVLVSVIVETL